MTTSRQYGDRDGEFGAWLDHPMRCGKLVPAPTPTCAACLADQCEQHRKPCGAPVQVRTWESSDGAYEDYQYRCTEGHTWWIDGIDA